MDISNKLTVDFGQTEHENFYHTINMANTLFKYFQRRTFTFLNTCWGFTLFLLLVYFSLYSLVTYVSLIAKPFDFFFTSLNLQLKDPCDFKR